VKIELGGDLFELRRSGLDDAEPDEAVATPGGCLCLLQAQITRAAMPMLVDGAVDDHRRSIALNLDQRTHDHGAIAGQGEVFGGIGGDV